MTAPQRYLLDTNVVSETRRNSPEVRVMDFLAATSAARLFLSVLTIGELRRGVERKRAADPSAADGLATWLDGLVSTYTGHILPVDAEVADRWGRLTSQRPRPVVDTLIAATALVHDLILVTRNTADVVGTGVAVHNPWTDEAE